MANNGSLVRIVVPIVLLVLLVVAIIALYYFKRASMKQHCCTVQDDGNLYNTESALGKVRFRVEGMFDNGVAGSHAASTEDNVDSGNNVQFIVPHKWSTLTSDRSVSTLDQSVLTSDDSGCSTYSPDTERPNHSMVKVLGWSSPSEDSGIECTNRPGVKAVSFANLLFVSFANPLFVSFAHLPFVDSQKTAMYSDTGKEQVSTPPVGTPTVVRELKGILKHTTPVSQQLAEVSDATPVSRVRVY